jgi:cytochrome c oxidase assembly factor CtaG
MSHESDRPDSRENGRVTRSLSFAADGSRRAPRDGGRRTLGAGLATLAFLGLAPVALAHGGVVPAVPPDALNLALGWSGDPLVWLPAIVALLLWRTGVRRVNRAHPANPVPRSRTWWWVAGVATVVVALDSGIGRYDTALFSVHMAQHLMLTLVAPPMLLLAGPITLLLRASSPETRRRWIFPVLHSRLVRVLAFPVVAWVLFAVVMWASHFSALFDLSLENEWIHRFEHALFLFAALLFWWPAVGRDPSPWRMEPPVRVLYVGLQMPQNTFLALAIYLATAPLYHHYATTIRGWGQTPLEDQQLAGGIMWLGGDLAFLTAVVLLVLAWMRHEERRTVGEDRRLEADRAAIREREGRLATRLAAEAGEPTTSGAGPRD